MTIPPDFSPTDVELLAEVHRIADPFVRAARTECGRVPGVGSTQWWAASATTRIAGFLVVGEAWLVHDPERAIAERFRELSHDLSGALDWSAASRRPSAAELQLRRAEVGPGCAPFDPVAAARWAATGSSEEPAT